MIKVVLYGGLGNQMFQYALGVALAEKNNVPLILDTTLLNDRFPRREVTFRTFDLDVFKIDPQFTALSKMSEKFPVPGLWVGLDIVWAMVRHLFGIQKVIQERQDHKFDPAVLDAGKNIVIKGYWHSENYFLDHAQKIKNEFSFKHALGGGAKDIAQQIRSSNSVSLHVRRGDYVSYKSVQATMGDVGLPYYKRAIEYMAQHTKTPHFFIFSNDIDWCKENIKPDFPTTYLGNDSAGPKNSFHLELMSLCKHNITANSTLSWWGAWLNSNPNKIVVAPKQWSIQDAVDKNNIIPKNWVAL
jgi:hypothetical protein